MRAFRSAIWLLAIVAGGCTVEKEEKPRPVISAPPPTKADVWLGVASSEDANRIQRIGTAWSEGLAEARKAGSANDIRAEGRLLDPNAGLSMPEPTPGSYSCRMVRLGRERSRGPAYQKFKPFFCYIDVEGDLFTIVKQTGSQRPAGRLWQDDNNNRLIFLGNGQ